MACKTEATKSRTRRRRQRGPRVAVVVFVAVAVGEICATNHGIGNRLNELRSSLEGERVNKGVSAGVIGSTQRRNARSRQQQEWGRSRTQRSN